MVLASQNCFMFVFCPDPSAESQVKSRDPACLSHAFFFKYSPPPQNIDAMVSIGYVELRLRLEINFHTQLKFRDDRLSSSLASSMSGGLESTANTMRKTVQLSKSLH